MKLLFHINWSKYRVRHHLFYVHMMPRVSSGMKNQIRTGTGRYFVRYWLPMVMANVSRKVEMNNENNL